MVGASLQAQLHADDTYFIAVDSLGRDGQPIWSGPYALEMIAVVQPQIDAARIVFDGARNLIGVYLRGRDRNLSNAAIRLVASNGSALHSRTTNSFGLLIYIQGTKMVNSLFSMGSSM